MQDAYRQHVLYECQSLRDEQCPTCLDLARAASAESGRLYGWADGWQDRERAAGKAGRP